MRVITRRPQRVTFFTNDVSNLIDLVTTDGYEQAVKISAKRPFAAQKPNLLARFRPI